MLYGRRNEVTVSTRHGVKYKSKKQKVKYLYLNTIVKYFRTFKYFIKFQSADCGVAVD